MNLEVFVWSEPKKEWYPFAKALMKRSDVVHGFEKFIIPLHKSDFIEGSDESFCQLCLSARSSKDQEHDIIHHFLIEADLDHDFDHQKLETVWMKYSELEEETKSRFMDAKDLSRLLQDILEIQRHKWIHRFQPSRVDRVFEYIKERVNINILADIFMKQLELGGNGKVTFESFSGRFHQAIHMFLKRIETDILHEPSKDHDDADKRAQLNHFFNRELEDLQSSHPCVLL